MREIKFRVYDKITKRYLNEEELNNIVMSMNGVAYRLYETKDFNGTNCYEIEWGSALNYILEQYTGLKDKNGVEIYEGDILLTHPNRDLIGYIYFENGEFKMTNDVIGRFWANTKYTTVKGNIHDNKELLDD